MPSEYAERRRRYQSLMGPKSVALLHSPPEVLRNGDAHFPFRQSSDLYYLTGFAEPETTVVLASEGETPFTLFVRARDPEREVWTGRRAGVDGVLERYGADAAFAADELDEKLGRLISNVDNLYYELGVDAAFDERLLATLVTLRRSGRKGLHPPKRIVDPRWSLHELRLHKSPREVEVLRAAAEITCEAHREAMKAARPGMHEYELEALIDYTFRRRGGMGPGYTTIVGGGDNATILHYIDNSAALAEGDLVLIDAGCELSYYTADVTRTFPVSGAFSPAQRRCYELVLEAQRQAIALVKPGATLDEIHECCVRVLTEGMIALGLLTGSVDERIADQSYRQFYMHRTSHWLGMDVHDVGIYAGESGAARPLESGMVLTVEPGLYIAASAEVAEEYRGIGIRIEDDVLVTEDGGEVLTDAVPKAPDEVETLCQN